MKVLVFGATGNLGHQLVEVFRNHGHDVVAATRQEIDLTELDPLRARVERLRPDVIVNAMAYNNVDGAEKEENRGVCESLNVVIPSLLAKVALGLGIRFVHYSTDYVFSGEEKMFYREDDAINPISAYGRSKGEGERAVMNADAAWYLCRLARIFGPPGTSPYAKPSFVTTMVRLSKEKPTIDVVDDEVGTPTYTRDVAEATVKLLEEAYPSGIYHFVNEGPGVTWFQFAQEIFAVLNRKIQLRAISSDAYPKLARRPKHVVLVNTKFPKLRSRHEALQAFFDEYPDLR